MSFLLGRRGRIWGVSGFAWEYLTRAGWGPGTGTLGGTPGRGWDHLGLSGDTQHQHPRGTSSRIGDISHRLLEGTPGLVSEHLARAESAQPHLRASGRSLIGYGAVRLRSGRPLFLCVFDKDVLFTSVMTFFYVSIEMGAPSASFGVFVMVFTGRSRRGFPRVFTAWVCQGVHGVGFPRVFTAWVFPGHSRRVGTALQFRLSFGLHAATRSPLGLRTPVSPVEGARAGPRFTRKRARRRSTPGTQRALPPIPAFPTKASAYSRFACINGRHTTGIGRKPWNRG